MNVLEIEIPNRETGTSYSQQEAMVRFLAQELGAGIRYVPLGDRCTAVVTLPNGRVYRFDVYGSKNGG